MGHYFLDIQYIQVVLYKLGQEFLDRVLAYKMDQDFLDMAQIISVCPKSL